MFAKRQKKKKKKNCWRKFCICKTIEIKEVLLKTCDERKDELAAQTRMRIHGAISDLQAIGARYHVDCFTGFVTKRSIMNASSTSCTSDSRPSAADISEIQWKDAQLEFGTLWNHMMHSNIVLAPQKPLLYPLRILRLKSALVIEPV